MMSNNVSESEKEIPTGCVSFYTQWFDVCVCIRVRGLHLVGFCVFGWLLFSCFVFLFPLICSVSFPSTMTWALRPHGVRTRGKTFARTGQQRFESQLTPELTAPVQRSHSPFSPCFTSDVQK